MCVGGRKIRGSALGFSLCPTVPLGCGSDTYVNAMGVGLAEYEKGCHLALLHFQPVSLYSFYYFF